MKRENPRLEVQGWSSKMTSKKQIQPRICQTPEEEYDDPPEQSKFHKFSLIFLEHQSFKILQSGNQISAKILH
jgi:hypothetical protein